MIPQTTEKTWIVAQPECDLQNQMTLGALLRQAQQISTDHCTLVGMDAAFFANTRTVFLLAKVSAEFLKPVTAGQTVRLVTVPYAPERAVFLRKSTLYCEDRPVATVEAHWILCDTETKRILRRLPENYPFPFTAVCDFSPAFFLPKKVETAEIGTTRALYSRCDNNRHMNNAAYADCICDALSEQIFAGKSPVRLDISYHNELPLGQEMTLFRGNCEEPDRYYLSGKSAVTHFEAAITLQ